MNAFSVNAWILNQAYVCVTTISVWTLYLYQTYVERCERIIRFRQTERLVYTFPERFSWDMIDLCHNFNGGLTKSPLKSERGWVIISQYFVSTLLFICALLSVNLLANGAHGPLTRYVKLWLRIRRERFPCHRGLAIPTCITARAWRMCRDACRDR